MISFSTFQVFLTPSTRVNNVGYTPSKLIFFTMAFSSWNPPNTHRIRKEPFSEILLTTGEYPGTRVSHPALVRISFGTPGGGLNNLLVKEQFLSIFLNYSFLGYTFLKETIILG